MLSPTGPYGPKGPKGPFGGLHCIYIGLHPIYTVLLCNTMYIPEGPKGSTYGAPAGPTGIT